MTKLLVEVVPLCLLDFLRLVSIFKLTMEFTDVDVTEIVFKERLAKQEYCMIFLVIIRGKTCVMRLVGKTPFWLDSTLTLL